MILTTKTKQHLKAKAHALHPIIIIGNQGLTTAVNKEIERALQDHELIKIRLGTIDKITRKTLATQISEEHQAILLQLIGHIGIFYRKKSS